MKEMSWHLKNCRTVSCLLE